MARLEDTEKRHNTHMVRTIRVRLYRTRMVRKIVPYAYGMYHTRMVHTIRVRYKIRIWYRTISLISLGMSVYRIEVNFGEFVVNPRGIVV